MATYIIFADTSDGYLRSSSATYLTARSGGGTVVVGSTTYAGAAGQVYSGGTYYCYEGFEQFNTSVVAGTISTAKLFLTAYSLSGTDTLQARIYNWGSSLVVGDWVPGASLSGDTLVCHLAESSFNAIGSYSAFVDDALAANVNQSGQTYLNISSLNLLNGTPPSATEYIGWYSRNNGYAVPYLQIVSSASPSGVVPLAIGAPVETRSGSTGEKFAQSPTTNNLLAFALVIDGTASLPSTPSGWTLGKQIAGTSCSANLYWKIAAGGDAAPAVAIASGYAWSQVVEFIGNASSPADQTASAAGTSSPLVATAGGTDSGSGELVFVVGTVYISGGGTPTTGHTPNNGVSLATQFNVPTSGEVDYFNFGWGLTTGNGSDDSDSFSFEVLS